MRIEFRCPDRDLIEIVIDGVPLLELVRRAELPYARQEQLERAEEYAPEQAPLLAGDYSYFTRSQCGWPSRHYVGEPGEVAYNQDDDETMLLGCTCGVAECWALLAKIEVTGSAVRWSGFRNNVRDWDLSGLGPFVFSREQYEQALRTTARGTRRSAAPRTPEVVDDLRLVPVVDVFSGLVHHLTPDHAGPPADKTLWDAYWIERVTAAGLPAPMPDDSNWIRLSDFLTGPHLTTLVQATQDQATQDQATQDQATQDQATLGQDLDDVLDLDAVLDIDDDALESVGCLSGGFLLLTGGRTLVAPGCCSDLGDLENWRNAARHTGAAPYLVWVGHPWVHVAAAGDDLLLTGPTEGDPGPETARLSRRALARAVEVAAAEVRYFARPLHEACARVVGEDRASAVCTALLGGSWLRTGAAWSS
ncbi:hypothetical protein [Nonomuraea insulae]|uniref:SUKH-4 immunity protein of toxin-antitoxin system n=1 Tax=Nonomuraea insulae TaxID=1616787 RepID=A0ABW1CUZ9_9ACTN